LSLDDCSAVPEAFCDWLTLKLELPGLETLSLENLETTVGPGMNYGWADLEEREE